MKLVSFEVQTPLGRFERIGALAHGTIVDLTSLCIAYSAESENAGDETLNVGDFFGSGPQVCSVGFDLDRWIKAGDVVE